MAFKFNPFTGTFDFFESVSRIVTFFHTLELTEDYFIQLNGEQVVQIIDNLTIENGEFI